jgi:hypothetical protein
MSVLVRSRREYAKGDLSRSTPDMIVIAHALSNEPECDAKLCRWGKLGTAPRNDQRRAWNETDQKLLSRKFDFEGGSHWSRSPEDILECVVEPIRRCLGRGRIREALDHDQTIDLAPVERIQESGVIFQ